MDSKQDSLKRYNSLAESQKVALCAYWFDLKKEPKLGIQQFINTFEDEACVFDVPDVLANPEKK